MRRRSLISAVLGPVLLSHRVQYKMISSLAEVALGLVLAVYYFLVKLVKLCLPAAWLEKEISGQVVLVTGGGSGIGRLMCLRFARLGATVVSWDINKVLCYHAARPPTSQLLERSAMRRRLR